MSRRTPLGDRARKVLVTLVVIGLWCLLGLACVGMALGAARLAGYQTFTILSGSMEPAIATGDLVFDKRVSAADALIGDVITFPEPGTPRLVTHRLVHKRIARDRAYMRTRGDANNASERWSIPAGRRIGRVEFSVPKGGYVSAWVTGRHTQLLLIVVPALLLGVLELVRIWRPRPREGRSSARPA